MQGIDQQVAITKEDVRFLELARDHYAIFAEVSEKQGNLHSAGIFRKQEFYAERFLSRVEHFSGPN